MGVTLLTITRSLLNVPPADHRAVNWGLKDILKLVGLYFIYQGVVGSPFHFLNVGTYLDEHFRLIINSLIGWVSFALVFWTHSRYHFWPGLHYFGLQTAHFTKYAELGAWWGMGLRACIITMLVIAAGVLSQLGVDINQWIGETPSILERVNPWSIAWLVVLVEVAVVAPFIEEYVCRGLLYGWLTTKYNVQVGRVVSSLVFSLLHGSLFMFLPTLILGFALVLLYERTRSLAPCVVAHAVFNLFAVWAAMVAR